MQKTLLPMIESLFMVFALFSKESDVRICGIEIALEEDGYYNPFR